MPTGPCKFKCESLQLLRKMRAIFVLAVLVGFPNDSRQGHHQKKLLENLLVPYNNLERPVANESEPLFLSLGLELQRIIDVDEKNQILITSAWLTLEWLDYNLKWKPDRYGGLREIRIPPHRIWKPDVLMVNSADEQFDATFPTNVVVSNGGACKFAPPGIFKSTCDMDITWFPFDEQVCTLEFMSWTYKTDQLDLHVANYKAEVGLSRFVRNGEWNLASAIATRTLSSKEKDKVSVQFALRLQRRAMYYLMNLIVPCVVITSVAIFGFLLPPDSLEKVGLGLTILLSLTVFLNMVAETMPATSDAIPLLSIYFNCIMLMMSVSVVCSILVLNLHFCGPNPHRMPAWMRCIFLKWLPFMLLMKPPIPKLDAGASHKEQMANNAIVPEATIAGAGTNPHQQELGAILDEIRFITHTVRARTLESQVVSEWKFAARVLDRLCLLGFTIFLITATTAFLLAPKSYVY